MVKKITALCLLLFITAGVKAQSIREYIDAHLEMAQKLMREDKVPASIVLGVAIHESAAGKSKIARHLNNHFGVKGKNNSTTIVSAYKGYESSEDSYRHFAEFLKKKPSYNKLFDAFSPYDYKNWAKGIQRGGYASSRTWASQVISLIQKYELYKYDERPEGYVEALLPGSEAVIRSVSNFSKPAAKKRSSFYTVKKGDNLNLLAKKQGTTAAALMKKNNLKTAALQPGQKLKL